MSEEWRRHDYGKRSAIVTEAGYTVIDACLKHGMAACIVAAHNAAVRRLTGQPATAFEAPAVVEPEPVTERPTYFVQATYATPNGRMGLWAGRMASATGDILADAERLIRKYRKVAGKLMITATAL